VLLSPAEKQMARDVYRAFRQAVFWITLILICFAIELVHHFGLIYTELGNVCWLTNLGRPSLLYQGVGHSGYETYVCVGILYFLGLWL
jgi:hypothetical protein